MYPTILDIYAQKTPKMAPCSKIGQKVANPMANPRLLLSHPKYNEPITALLYWRHKGWRPYNVPYDSALVVH